MLKLELSDSVNIKNIEKSIETEMDVHIKHLEKELVKIRTGKAQPAMIEDIRVACYGAIRPLKEVAAISAPDVNMLIVQPWDTSIFADIEKALATSDLGVTPQNDGTVIRLVIPRMSGSRRDELVKVLHKKLEESRINIRNVRKDVHGVIRDAERTKKVSEDFSRRLQDVLQKSTDKMIGAIDKLGQKKEEEIRLL